MFFADFALNFASESACLAFAAAERCMSPWG